MPNLYKKMFWGAIDDFHGFQKGTLWTTFSPNQARKPHNPDWLIPSLSRPCFSRNHNSYCAVWTKCLKQNHFFDEAWLLLILFCFSLCYVLYAIFITFVDKTTVNAQPLSPPIFEKIAPHFKNNVFSYFGSLRLRFLYFFIFVLIFGCPFPPPWPRLVPFVVDFGPIFVRFW